MSPEAKIRRRARRREIFRQRRQQKWEGKVPFVRVNRPERTFEEEMLKAGIATTKRGWPDFICYEGFGEKERIFCVEVKKSETHPVSPQQERIMNWLTRHGIECRRWDPINGFTDFKR